MSSETLQNAPGADAASAAPTAGSTRTALVWVAAALLIAGAIGAGFVLLRVQHREEYLSARHARAAAGAAERIRIAIEAHATAVLQAARAGTFMAQQAGRGALVNELRTRFDAEFIKQVGDSRLVALPWSRARDCMGPGGARIGEDELAIGFCPRMSGALATNHHQRATWPSLPAREPNVSSDLVSYCIQPRGIPGDPFCVARPLEALIPPFSEALNNADVFIADESGVLHLRRFPSSIRLRRLEPSPSGGATKKPKDAKSSSPDAADVSWPAMSSLLSGSKLSFVKYADDEDFQLLTEPFSIPVRIALGRDVASDAPRSHGGLVLGVLLRAKQLQAEAATISLASTRLLLSALIVLVFLPPIVKLWMSGSRERFRPIEVFFLFVAVTALAGFSTLALLHFASTISLQTRSDDEMAAAAKELRDGIGRDLARAAEQLEKFASLRSQSLIDSDLGPDEFVWCETQHESQTRSLDCGVGALATDTRQSPRRRRRSAAATAAMIADLVRMTPWIPTDAQLVSLVDAQGRQLEKWNAVGTVTWQTALAGFSIFEDAYRGPMHDIPLQLVRGGGQSFAFNVLASPNTTKVLTLISIPFDHPGSRKGHAPAVALASISLPSLERPLPFGTSFAVVEGNGRVLVHSDETRALHENFLTETDDNATLASRLTSGQPGVLEVDYHGRPHRMWVSRLEGLPFSLILFRNSEGLRTPLIEVTLVSGAGFMLFGLLWLLPLATFGAVGRVSGNAWIWPDRIDPVRYLPLIVALVVIAVLQLQAMTTRVGAAMLVAVFSCGTLALALSFLWLDRRRPTDGPRLPTLGLLPTQRWWRSMHSLARRVTRRRVASVAWIGIAVWLFVASAGDFGGWSCARLLPLAFGVAAVARRPRLLGGWRSAATVLTGPSKVKYTYVAAGVLVLIVTAILPAIALFRDAFDDSLEQVEERCIRKQAKGDEPAWAQIEAGCRDVRSSSRDQPDTGRIVHPPLARQLGHTSDAARFVVRSVAASLGVAAGEESNLVPCTQDNPFACRLSSVLKAWFPLVNQESIELRTMPTRGDSLLVRVLGGYVSPIGALLGFFGLIGGLAWLVKEIARRLFGATVLWRPHEPCTSADAISWRGDLLIGPTPHQIDLYRARVPENSEDAVEVDCSEFASPDAFQGLAGTNLDLERTKEVWLREFDHLINDQQWNQARLALLERLLRQKVRIVLICEVDPLEYIHGRLRSDSDPATNRTYVSAIELDRWARALMPFRKLWLSEHDLSGDVAATWARDLGLRATLKYETSATPVLVGIRILLAHMPPRRQLDAAELVWWIGEMAAAHYRVIWAECTDDEKVLLWRLSYDGFIAPRSWRTAKRLLRRGLLRLDPSLTLMNESFRQFVENVEPWREIRRWQSAGEPSPWRALRPVFVLGLLIVGVALYAAQPDEVGRWMALITASLGGLGTLAQVVALARGRSSAAPGRAAAEG